MNVAALSARLTAVAPIAGVSLGKLDDKSTWRIDFAPEATPEHQVAAQEVIDAFDPDAPWVPQSVTPYQARMALNAASLRQAAEAAISGSSQDVKDAWEYALTIERDSPFIEEIAVALGLSQQEIDALFVSAGSY